jgi:septal ring factor EnvC (AmiA/AmiB activator)
VKGIAIVIGLNIAALIGIYIYFKRRIDKSLRSNELIATVRGEMEQLVTELNQTTNRNVEIIEERINQLKAISARADKQIKLLTKEIEKKEKETDTYSSIRYKKFSGAEKENLGTGGREEPDRGETATSDVRKQKPRRERVLELYRLGMNMEEIAKKLEMTMSEIELIISLEERKK